MNKYNRIITLLTEYIDNNNLPAQSKLPPERTLCEIVSANRGELRKALKTLETSGKIWRHVGKGTYVGSRPIDNTDETRALSARTNPNEIMQARLLIEPGLARISALYATYEDVERLKQCCQKKDAALDWQSYEHWDSKFHLAIAESTRNTLLLDIFNTLNTVREATKWGQLRRQKLTKKHQMRSSREHQAIIKAIVDRDMEQAKEAMYKHLKSVQNSLLGHGNE